MATGEDKGGLNYPISVDYSSAGVQAFIADIERAKGAVADFRATLSGGAAAAKFAASIKVVTEATRERADASRDAAEATSLEEKAQAKLNKIQLKQLVDEEARKQATEGSARAIRAKVGALTFEEQVQDRVAKARQRASLAAATEAQLIELGIKKAKEKAKALTIEEEASQSLADQVRARLVDAARERLALRQGIDLSKDKQKALTAEEQALQIINRSIATRAKNEALAARGFDTSGQFVGIQRAQKDLRELNDTTERTTRSGNSLLFTFRRLIGVFAAFAALRAAVSGTLNVITEAISLNAEIEKSRLGIAALLTGVSSVRDATGATVDRATALVLAQKESARQVALLRRDAVLTAASFQDLAETFQTALGPGLAAGLDPDQVRHFTIQISQAASALGVASNQLGEEIRSLLTGTITARTTRIATSLGITNEDIKRAREAGNLADFLEKRFKAFTIAGQEGLNTFDQILSNLKDSFEQILSAAGLDFFESLKGLLKDIQRELLIQNNDGILTPRPELVGIFRDMLSAITETVGASRELVRNFATLLPIAKSFTSALGFATRDAGQIALFASVFNDNALDQVTADFFKILIEGFAKFQRGGEVDNKFKAFGIGIVNTFKVMAAESIQQLLAVSQATDKLTGGTSLTTLGLQATLTSLGQSIKASGDEITQLLTNVEGNQDPFSLLTPIIVGTRRETDGLVDSVKRLSDELKDAEIATKIAEINANFSGDATSKQAEITLKGQEQLRKANLQIAQEEAALAKQIFDLDVRRLQVEQQLLGIGATGKQDGDLAVRNLQTLVDKQNEAAKAKASGDTARAGALQAEADALQAQIQNRFSKQVTDLAQSRINLAAQETVAVERLGELQKERAATEQQINEITQERLKAQAIEAAAASRENIRKTRLEIASLEAESQASISKAAARDAVIAQHQKGGFQGADANLQARTVEQQAQVEAVRAEIVLLQERQAIAREDAVTQIQRTSDLNERFVLQQKLFAQDQANGLAQVENFQNLREAEIQLNLLKREAESPVQLGIQVALENLDISPFQATVDVMTSVIQGFAQTASAAIVDAFTDPQADIQQSFANLFKQIAQQLIQLAIQAAIVRAGAALGFSGGGSVPTGPGRARGGQVFGGNFAPSAAHFGSTARGFMDGGRPAGIPASDTVPAWLTPREFIEPVASVDTYGLDFMEAIRRRAIDPKIIRMLMGGAVPTVSVSRSPTNRFSFASGGAVPEARSSGIGRSSAPTPAYIVPSDQAAENFLNGGQQGALRWIRENQAGVRTALGIK